MKSISNLASAAIVAILASAIAIISVQNATLVSLGVFGLRSIKIPFGVVLAFSLSLGIVAGAIAPLFWRSLENPNSALDEDDYFEEDF